MLLAGKLFDTQFAHFKESIRRASGRAFTSFDEGLAHDWESYKPTLRREALRRLSSGQWRTARPGDGQILSYAIDAIEITVSERSLSNNLVRWENRYGHANRSHRALLDAQANKASCLEFEKWLLAFFLERLESSVAFERFRRLAGNRYDLIAYLFFLRDADQFMPIATTTFDEAFELLGIDLVTRQQCSWENYKQYNDTLVQVQHALRDRAGIVDARLIDAHSFCWMLVRVDRELINSNVAPASNRSKKQPGKSLDARSKSVWEMADGVEQTVRNAQGQVVERILKRKELRMTRQALESYIQMLLDKQEDKCALTGIAFQYRGEQKDEQLLPSLDRIDSNGHYEAGNLQVVCRFINSWKSDTSDHEFRRLLSLIRGDDP